MTAPKIVLINKIEISTLNGSIFSLSDLRLLVDAASSFDGQSEVRIKQHDAMDQRDSSSASITITSKPSR